MTNIVSHFFYSIVKMILPSRHREVNAKPAEMVQEQVNNKRLERMTTMTMRKKRKKTRKKRSKCEIVSMRILPFSFFFASFFC